MKTKVCKKCKKKKSFSAFSKAKRGKYGYNSQCKVCINSYQRQWYKINPAKLVEKNRKNKLKINFGMTVDDYDKMFQQQNGVCLICGKPETSKNQWGLRRMGVDHNHKSGKVRGLLCSKHNLGIGLFNVDEQGIELLLKAVEYIRKTNK